MGRTTDFERAVESLYNRPLLTFSRPLTREDLHPYERQWKVPKGSRFLRWHELTDEQQDRVRSDFRGRVPLPAAGAQTEAEPESLTQGSVGEGGVDG